MHENNTPPLIHHMVFMKDELKLQSNQGKKEREGKRVNTGQRIYYLNINTEGKIPFWQSLFTQRRRVKFQGNSLHQIQELERM